MGRTLMTQPRVGVIMGSDSDWPVMEAAVKILAEFGVSAAEIAALGTDGFRDGARVKIAESARRGLAAYHVPDARALPLYARALSLAAQDARDAGEAPAGFEFDADAAAEASPEAAAEAASEAAGAALLRGQPALKAWAGAPPDRGGRGEASDSTGRCRHPGDRQDLSRQLGPAHLSGEFRDADRSAARAIGRT